MGLNWQCCLASSSQTAPRIFIFSIVLGTQYLSYVKFIAIYALTFLGYIISVLASVMSTIFQQKPPAETRLGSLSKKLFRRSNEGQDLVSFYARSPILIHDD